MSGEILVVTLGDAGIGLLGEVLASRGRPVRTVTDPAGLPSAPDGLRGVAVLPGGPSAPALDELLAACGGADVPVLGIGAAALRVAAATGLATVADEAPVAALTTVTGTDAAAEDPVVATMPSGAWWLVDTAAAITPADPEAVLARDQDGAPVVLARGRTYAVLMRADLDGDAVEALVGADTIPPRARPFLTGWAASLVGRWIDLVVGRTEEEMPWGRRGPQPVPAPGLSLNPA